MSAPSLTRFKVCTKCRCLKPATNVFFGKRAASKDGLVWQCYICRNLEGRRHREKNLEKYLATEDEYRSKNRVQINASRQKWRNQAHVQEKARQYRERTKEQAAEQKRRYREENYERVTEYQRLYYEANREKVLEYSRGHYQRNKELRYNQTKQWQGDNPEKVRAYQHQYQGRKRNQKGEPYGGGDIIRMHENQDGCCYYCQEKLIEYHVEHMTPISRGGLDCIHNIALACPTCNLRKSDKTAEEFLEVTHGAAL